MTTLREATQQAQAKQIRKAYDLLIDFLQNHPEHDQADLRVFDASELLEHALAEPTSKDSLQVEREGG